jgi:hypothetical protein
MAGCGEAAPPEPAGPTPTPYGEQLVPVGAAASSETAWGSANTIDGSLRSRWKPLGNDDEEWVYVDLGDTYLITRVIIYWETDYEGPFIEDTFAAEYQIQVSDDAENWTTVRDVTYGSGGTEDHTGLDATGRYLRINATERSDDSPYYEIWEIEVFGISPSE